MNLSNDYREESIMYDLYISSRKWQAVVAVGIVLMLAGLIILIEPMILVAIIAVSFISVGMFISWFAWRSRHSKKSKEHIYVRWDV